MQIIGRLFSQVGDRTAQSNMGVAAECIHNPDYLKEIETGLLSSDVKLIGDCAEVFTEVAKEKPEVVAPYAEKLAKLLSHNTTRVRWEAMHAVALTAHLVPLVIELLLPQIEQILQKDNSTIVRDYAVDTLGNYASIGTEQAHQAFPILKNMLNLWDGKHTKQVLLGFINIAGATQAYNEEICKIGENYLDHKKGVVRKAAKAALKAAGSR